MHPYFSIFGNMWKMVLLENIYSVLIVTGWFLLGDYYYFNLWFIVSHWKLGVSRHFGPPRSISCCGMNCLVIHCLVHSSRLAGGFCFCALTQHLERGRKEREVTPAGRSKTKRFGITCTARLYLLLLAVTTRRVLILKLLLCTLSSRYEINRRKTLHQSGDMTDYCRAFPCRNKRFLHA